MTRTRIKDLPPEERPRERLLRSGPGSLSVTELLAVLLGSGDGRGRNALDLAQQLLVAYQPAQALVEPAPAVSSGLDGCGPALSALARAPAAELSRLHGFGPAKACRVVAGLELGRRAGAVRLDRRAVRSPQDVVDLLGQRLARLDREHFVVVLLDTKNHVLAVEPIAVGSLDASLVHPREIFKAAVRLSAAAVVLVHNHPSGDPTPSEADIKCTGRLAETGRILGIGVLDHIIIGEARFVSFRDGGIGGL